MAYSQSLMRKATAWLVGAAMLLPLTAFAEVPMPNIPKAKGEKCVEPAEDMRKNHMEYMLHQRNDTLRRGIRTTKYSLKECIECHNAPDAQGQVVSVDGPDHFCSNCHSYTAVKIDCFECHADKPEKGNYKHSLVDKPMPAHAGLHDDDKDLSQPSLDVLAARGEKQ